MERAGPGDPCEENDDCEEGLLCTEQEPSVCADPATEGESCRATTQPCVPPLACWGEDTANDVAGECVDLNGRFTADEGEACGWLGPWCRTGLFCDLTAGTCTSERPGSGGQCVLTLPDQCPDGEWCDTSAEPPYPCVPIPGDGEPCTAERFGARCQPSQACLDDGLCHALQRLGEACDVDGECYSGNCDSGGCAAPDPCAGG